MKTLAKLNRSGLGLAALFTLVVAFELYILFDAFLLSRPGEVSGSAMSKAAVVAVCFLPTAFYAGAYWWALATKTALYVSKDRLTFLNRWVWSMRLEDIREVAPAAPPGKTKSLTFIDQSGASKALQIGGFDKSEDELIEVISKEFRGVRSA